MLIIRTPQKCIVLLFMNWVTLSIVLNVSRLARFLIFGVSHEVSLNRKASFAMSRLQEPYKLY